MAEAERACTKRRAAADATSSRELARGEIRLLGERTALRAERKVAAGATQRPVRSRIAVLQTVDSRAWTNGWVEWLLDQYQFK